MNKIVYLTVYIGDCEFIDEFTLECTDIDSANKLKESIEEKCNNVLYTEIKENKW